MRTRTNGSGEITSLTQNDLGCPSGSQCRSLRSLPEQYFYYLEQKSSLNTSNPWNNADKETKMTSDIQETSSVAVKWH